MDSLTISISRASIERQFVTPPIKIRDHGHTVNIQYVCDEKMSDPMTMECDVTADNIE